MVAVVALIAVGVSGGIGAYKAAEVVPLLDKYFGRIPARPSPAPLRTVEPPQAAEKTANMARPIRSSVVFPTAETTATTRLPAGERDGATPGAGALPAPAAGGEGHAPGVPGGPGC